MSHERHVATRSMVLGSLAKMKYTRFVRAECSSSSAITGISASGLPCDELSKMSRKTEEKAANPALRTLYVTAPERITMSAPAS